MKLSYTQVKGRRIKRRGFWAITTLDGYYWVYQERKWMKNKDIPHPHTGYSSHLFDGCKSVKAFTRRLKKWSNYLPKGTQFILVSRWARHDVYGVV